MKTFSLRYTSGGGRAIVPRVGDCLEHARARKYAHHGIGRVPLLGEIGVIPRRLADGEPRGKAGWFCPNQSKRSKQRKDPTGLKRQNALSRFLKRSIGGAERYLGIDLYQCVIDSTSLFWCDEARQPASSSSQEIDHVRRFLGVDQQEPGRPG